MFCGFGSHFFAEATDGLPVCAFAQVHYQADVLLAFVEVLKYQHQFVLRGKCFVCFFKYGVEFGHSAAAIPYETCNLVVAPFCDAFVVYDARKRYIIECINDLLKNKANLVHSRHRSVHNFLVNLCSALTAYCFFDNKPEALPVHIEKTAQQELF